MKREKEKKTNEQLSVEIVIKICEIVWKDYGGKDLWKR